MESLLKDRDKYHDIKALVDTRGGQTLVRLLLEDIVGLINQLSNSDKDPLCARLKASLDLLSLLQNSEENEKVVDEALADALSE